MAKRILVVEDERVIAGAVAALRHDLDGTWPNRLPMGPLPGSGPTRPDA